VHDSVAVCGDVPKVTLAGNVQVNPAGVDADAARLTVPVRPLTAVTVMVDVPELPASIWVGDTGPAAMVKSTTWKRIVAVVCDRVPLVPVTVTVYCPAVAALHDSVAVCGLVPNVTLAGNVQVRPAGVDTDTARLTVPVNPFTAVTVTVEVPDAPAKIWAGDTTPAAIEKSTTWNRIGEVVWDRVPLVPVTVTV
jgi:hypothetical protein